MSPLSSSSSPITVLGGSWKSRTDEPSRRNSGFTQMPNPSPARSPDASSSTGTSRSSHVPGIIVERKTTVYRSSRPRSAAPISPGDAARGRRSTGRRRGRRRADADQRQIRGCDRRVRVGGRAEPAGADDLAVEIADPLLDHGGASGGDRVDLRAAEVDAHDVVAELGEAGGRHRPDVPEPEDRDLRPTRIGHATAPLVPCRRGPWYPAPRRRPARFTPAGCV